MQEEKQHKLILTDRERLMLRALILSRQAGNASGTVSFYMRSDSEAKSKALFEHLKCDLGDLLLQTKLLIKDLDINEDEVLNLAYDRWDESKQRFKDNKKSQYFI